MCLDGGVRTSTASIGLRKRRELGVDNFRMGAPCLGAPDPISCAITACSCGEPRSQERPSSPTRAPGASPIVRLGLKQSTQSKSYKSDFIVQQLKQLQEPLL